MEKKSKVVSKRLRKQLDELERSKRYDEATQLLEPIARRGNADAQYEIGELLYHKMVHEAEAVVRNYSNFEKAIFWSDLSRKPELCKADFSDFSKMIDWYEKAVEQKHAKAMVELAEWYTPIVSRSSVKHVIKQSSFFTLKCDFNYALSLYIEALESGGDDSFFDVCVIENLLHSPHVPQKVKDKVVDILQARVKKGCCHAADHLFRIWESKYRSPQRKPYYDMQIDEHELLHTDWFRLLLDHEAECEKKNEYSAGDALRLLSDLAKNGNQEALDMLTGIGMKTGGSSACWAGDVYYERKEYKKALECYLAGEYVYKLGGMYERGEGTTPDMEKAFYYYKQANDNYNIGRMYEQGLGTKKDLRKAFECYHKIVDRKIYEHDSEEEKNEILSARCSFRRLKKILFEQKDEIRMTVAAKGQKSVCGFSFTSYGDCQFTIDWGDGQEEAINNEKGEEIQAEHTYAKLGKWNISLRSNETHTITSFHYTCETCILKALDVTQCPILIDLYCVNQGLKRLNVSKNPRLGRLVCRGNKLKILNIRRNNRLTQLDCSDNPELYHVDWNPQYSALTKVCMKNIINFDQLDFLDYLLKRNKGQKCEPIAEASFDPVFLPLSYYMRCLNWSDVKAKIKEGGYPIWKEHSWRKYKSAFDDMSSREDFHYTGIDRIVCEGGYTYYWLYSSREKKYIHQDLEDVVMNLMPWSETLDMPVEIREKEGWMMFPQVTWADVFCPCFIEMTCSHWKETEEIIQWERDYWERHRQRQKKYE